MSAAYPLGTVRIAERTVRENLVEPLAVIGEVKRTISGNVALRVGRSAYGGWTQTEYVVLTPDERRQLIADLQALDECTCSNIAAYYSHDCPAHRHHNGGLKPGCTVGGKS